MLDLNLLVLRCSDLERAKAFYECLDLEFEKHRHGDGPEHYAVEQDGCVLELYPADVGVAGDGTGLGFAVPGQIVDRPWGRTFVIRDPDHRRVECKQS
jgi:lactoylglutathione lyase